jgi:hypothetical protein
MRIQKGKPNFGHNCKKMREASVSVFNSTVILKLTIWRQCFLPFFYGKQYDIGIFKKVTFVASVNSSIHCVLCSGEPVLHTRSVTNWLRPSQTSISTIEMHWNQPSANWNDLSANTRNVAVLQFHCKNGFIQETIYFQNTIHILHVYFIKECSVKTQLQISFNLYSRIAEDDSSDVKIEGL